MQQDISWMAGAHLVVPGDPLKTLENCEGHYACPMGPDGKPLGPVVGYTAQYEPGKHWVGLEYFNFSQADQWPAVIIEFARQMLKSLDALGVLHESIDLIVGAPWAGVKFSQAVALTIGCRQIFAEKKDDELILGRYEGMVHPGDRVLIGEELVNNASTTKKLIELIRLQGGEVIGITCAINRSYPFRSFFGGTQDEAPIPIVGVIERSTPQYRQDDPVVADTIATGNVVWKPKYEWGRMKAAMDAAKQLAGIRDIVQAHGGQVL